MNSLFTLNPDSIPSNMSGVADILGDVEAGDLRELDRFELKCRPYMNGMQKSSVNINTPSEYPKLLDFEDYFN